MRVEGDSLAKGIRICIFEEMMCIGKRLKRNETVNDVNIWREEHSRETQSREWPLGVKPLGLMG